MRGVGLTSSQIDVIAAWSGESMSELAAIAGVNKSTASQWKILIHGRSRSSSDDFDRYKALLRKVESDESIIECVEGEMEFNSSVRVLQSVCAKHLGLTYFEVEHCIKCLVNSRSRKRWANAVKKNSKKGLRYE